ncbi:helix-hairpin-helix domain-containing protein [bacterium]|nr:helix-hairpin-helix domain-containing protein [candidate division CSSED10-310 bacterium]
MIMKKLLILGLMAIAITVLNGQILAKVNINTAMGSELETLPRIGPGLAQSIVEYRNQHGPFKKIEDIMNVPRIGEKTFQELKDLITVGNQGQDTHSKPETAQQESGSSIPYEPIVKIPAEPTPTPTPEPSIEEIFSYFQNEPSIQDVHKAALDYAQIHQETFINWRKNVKNRALFPDTVQMTVGHDTDDDTDYSKSKSISLSGGTVTIGPDDETWGHDTDDDWDYELRLKWNLQDYIFHPDMLRVTSETEDQVELRQDILNEVTKLYFDRRRLQVEILLEPGVDLQTKISRMIRLEELTAALDGLTGGYFSSQILKNSAEKPE